MQEQGYSEETKGKIETIIEFLTLIGKKDFTGASEHLHPEAVMELPYFESVPPLVGRDTIINQFLATSDKIHERMDFTFNAWYPTLDPDVIIVECDSYCPLIGGEGVYENDYITIFRFKADKIILYREYLNPAKINFEI